MLVIMARVSRQGSCLEGVMCPYRGFVLAAVVDTLKAL